MDLDKLSEMTEGYSGSDIRVKFLCLLQGSMSTSSLGDSIAGTEE